jgi:hypothetical protein
MAKFKVDRELRCQSCGSTEVEWGRSWNEQWVLVDIATNEEHECEEKA